MEAVEEESSVWKKNTPLLYDFMICHSLEWPSLTVQWLPSPPLTGEGDLAVHKLVLGTHTSDGSPNFLMLADAYLPLDPSAPIEADPQKLNIPKVQITHRMQVDGEVNRARCMPQIPTIIAAKTCATEVYVIDSRKELGSYEPDLRLRGHDKEGYGLSWNSFKEGNLLSGSNDCKICLWDVSATGSGNKVVDATYIYEGHEDIVEDVSWHPKNEHLFGSVGDDCKLIIWDTRTNKFQHNVVHEKEVNYLSFNPFNEWVLATASSDTTVGLFDIRNLSSPFHALTSNMEEVFQVEWDPNHETILASSADDRRLTVWDINRVGDEQWEGEAEDGPSELLFSHGGHKAKISDLSWNKYMPWTIASVAEDNTLQVWQLAESIYRDDEKAEAASDD